MKTRKTIITENDIVNIDNELKACCSILKVCKPQSIRFELMLNKISDLILTRKGLVKIFNSKNNYG